MNEVMRSKHADETLRLDVHGAFIRRADLSHANLERADLSFADCTNAIFVGANFKGTKLKGTILKGADLREARNLTWEQLDQAVVDSSTRLPSYLTHKRQE